MIRALFLFPNSADSQELDILLSEGFNSERKNALGMYRLEISSGGIMSPSGPPPYARVIEVTLDSMDDMWKIIRSPESQARTAQMKSLGVLIMAYEVNEL